MQTMLQQQAPGALLCGPGLRPRAPARSTPLVRCSARWEGEAAAARPTHAAAALALGSALLLAVAPAAEAAKAVAPVKADPYSVSSLPYIMYASTSRVG